MSETADAFDEAVRAEWRRQASANAERIRVEVAEREKGDVSAMMEEMIGLAVKATGLTRAQLLDEFRKLPPPEPFRPQQVSPARRARLRMAEALVPELHIQNVADADPLPCDALAAVKELLCDTKKTLLVLSGGVGTCRTGSASWLLGQLAGGVFVEAEDLLSIALENKALYLRVKRARVVVVDDLGAEIADPKGHWKKTFNALFNAWYSSLAVVVITTNLTVEQFRDKYGERVADRLRERGRFVEIGGTSVRGK